MGKISYRLLLLLIFIMPFLASAQDKAHFAVISVDNASKLTQLTSWKGTGSPFTPAAFSPDGSQLAIALSNTQIVFVSTEILEITRTIDHVESEGQWLNYSADGSELLLSEGHGAYRLWNVTTGAVIASQSGSGNGSAYWFSPTTDVRKYLLYSFDHHYVSVIDTVTGEELLHVDDVKHYALSPDGTLLLTRSPDYTVHVWDVQTGEVRLELQPPVNLANGSFGDGVGFTPDGHLWVNWVEYSKVNDKSVWFSPIQFWDVESKTMVLQLDGPYAEVIDLLLDPAKKLVVVSGIDFRSYSDMCWMWNLEQNEQIICYAPGAANFAFSPDGTMLAYNHGTIPTTRIQEIDKQQSEIALLDTPPSGFIEFSPDGRLLLTIDQEVRLWGIPE